MASPLIASPTPLKQSSVPETLDLNASLNPSISESSEKLADYIALLKPRVMSLVVFTGLCGLLMAPGSIHPLIGFMAILCIAVGAGASGCLNMWYDRDIDCLMSRTKNRPLPMNKIAPNNALAFGLILSAASVLIMGVIVNWLSSFLLAFTIFFYVVIYSMWLKRSTPQNIVIGGAAGALPPVIGWAAVTNSAPLESWILFAIIFIWTPPHFWALALYRHQDYIAANIPMLPVVSGELVTKRQILLYSLALVGVTMLPYFMAMTSLFFAGFSGALGLVFLGLAARVYVSSNHKDAMILFAYSILYLFLIFLGITMDVLWGRMG